MGFIGLTSVVVFSRFEHFWNAAWSEPIYTPEAQTHLLTWPGRFATETHFLLTMMQPMVCTVSAPPGPEPTTDGGCWVRRFRARDCMEVRRGFGFRFRFKGLQFFCAGEGGVGGSGSGSGFTAGRRGGLGVRVQAGRFSSWEGGGWGLGSGSGFGFRFCFFFLGGGEGSGSGSGYIYRAGGGGGRGVRVQVRGRRSRLGSSLGCILFFGRGGGRFRFGFGFTDGG